MTERSRLIELTAEIVASFVSCNPLPAADLPAFISSTHAALAALNEPCEEAGPHAEAAVPIDESIYDDYLVCLEDGQKLKSLKRHLQTPLRDDARAVSGEMGAARRLSDGSARVLGATLNHREESSRRRRQTASSGQVLRGGGARSRRRMRRFVIAAFPHTNSAV